MYIYTLLKQNGTTEVLDTAKTKWKYEQLRDTVGGYIEIIPNSYYPKGMTGTVYGHEEARFNSDNHTNSHLKTITDILKKNKPKHNMLVITRTNRTPKCIRHFK